MSEAFRRLSILEYIPRRSFRVSFRVHASKIFLLHGSLENCSRFSPTMSKITVSYESGMHCDETRIPGL